MTVLLRSAVAAIVLGVAATSAFADDMKKVAISTIVEVPALTDTKQGIIDALAARGYVDGETITIDYQNANGNMPTQQQIAKKFVGDSPDIIMPITTPTSQAMVSATSDIPIVFSTVTDPVKAKLISQYEKPGGNVTGVSDAAPIEPQLDLFQEIVPDLKKIGFIYNPGLDNAVATLGWVKEFGAPRGIEVVESPAPTTNEVILATKKLIGEVDAIYIPNDTTIVAALEAIVKVGQDVDLPIFTGETGGVERGAIASVGLDYIGIGEIAGNMAADVLEGKPVGEIDAVIAYKVLDKFKVVINKGAAERMGVTIPESVMAQATQVIE
ncbi:ABC transporter substrate-binding protein [Hoeflea sp. WL0058]|uniref:ABC transporter substrate-binding protein n=1 Tax=Flavimaribacter sediminis TaxID=2865987 RepID=A0AAE3CY01_9HYPH|nr:ABC transporter substrate-binding protein [Flavimaribacter sediminis]MBW8635645.1 ABC transporter substrate-binding protein [Flavimaribacter sediminis]